MRKAKHATIQGPSSHYVDIKQEPPGTPTGQVATATAAGPSFQFLQNINQEPIDSSLLSMQSSSQSSFSPGSSQVSNLSLTQSTSLSNISGSVCGSFDIDEDSQFSHSSSKNDMWLTEHDLKADSSLPNLLMTEDMDNVDSESDLEIDPGMITPPLGSPSNQPDSPTINDLLMSITSTDDLSASMDCNQSEDSLSGQGYETLNIKESEEKASGQIKNTPLGKDDQSVVDSESEKESESENSSSEDSDSTAAVQSESRPKLKRTKAKVVDAAEESLPPPK
ncbi:clumping factor A-like [Argopecten irradians]|uniref:clumping factor A-like n=1 Tax=Argopecten irradians TaxID=31199 RepID=UPI0037136A56